MEQWLLDGIPDNPRAWLVSTGRFKVIDALRRRSHSQDVREKIAQRLDELSRVNAERAARDRRRSLAARVHELSPGAFFRGASEMTLREVCGLSTEQIAVAFLSAPTAIAQRIVRAKAKIRDAGIPFKVPSVREFPQRLESVLSVIYLVFNEGYSASSGESMTRADLSREAIRLGRLVMELLPDPEVFELLALMLLHESRRTVDYWVLTTNS